ncbi:MAG: acyl-CoA/acyl-ACP dehydrogenase [Acetobacteraceae bacterium]|nr:acyl-CoA/acyl-ACP dehydrogenase [Acetobacteraceae bacterium]
MSASLDPALAGWLEAAAPGLDDGSADARDVLRRLGAAGLFALGVPRAEGGAGGAVMHAVEAIAAVSAHSMAAGFLFWSQRTFIEYLLQSPNAPLRERLLPGLLAGRIAGATGLSNAMKFLSGLEDLQVAARAEGAGWRIEGRLPWVTNLVPGGFHVAAAVAVPDGAPFVAALPHDLPGLVRSPDLALMGMRATATAAIALRDAPVEPAAVLHADALRWLPQVRPAFLGLQCGMAIGLARRALAEAAAQAGPAREALRPEREGLAERLAAEERALREGLAQGRFLREPAALFRIRIAFAGIVAEAAGLELQASGGRAYLRPQGEGFARRWREAAFVPVITPSLTQLKAALAAAEDRAERAA